MTLYERLKEVRVQTGKDITVEVIYKDAKAAMFQVDRVNLNDKQLLMEAFKSVFLQVENKGRSVENKWRI